MAGNAKGLRATSSASALLPTAWSHRARLRQTAPLDDETTAAGDARPAKPTDCARPKPSTFATPCSQSNHA